MAASVGLALTLAVPVSGAVQDAASSYRAQSAIDEFYRARGGQPLWLTGDPGGQALIELLQSSALDGVDPGRLMTKPLRNALRSARSGSPAAVARADRLLSEAFLTYVSLMRPAASGGWTVIDRELIPQLPPARALLGQAAASPDRGQWLDSMPWMHATYVDLRRSLAQTNDPRRAELIRINLERARFLPAGAGRHIVVNAAAQRLTMYEDGRPVDWMRVVVGKPAQPTPKMAALIRFTATNP
jgi:murein L,D-transpeptidase YcbB/YkuD